MRTLTHYRLAKYCFPLLPPNTSFRNAFLIGCVEPDVNLFSHIALSKHENTPELRGHNHPYLKTKISRMAKKLTAQQDKTAPLYAFRLGILLHYLSDAFTYAHNLEFSGDFQAHNAYEKAFHRYFEKRLSHLPQDFWSKTQPFSYPKLRAHYLAQKPSFARDFCCILLAARGVLQTYLPRSL